MRTIVTALTMVLTVGAAIPAWAGIEDKAKNTAINAGAGVIECPKAWIDEASRGGARGAVGAVVTGPVMCGANVAVRYLGVAADLVTLPWNGNLVKPNALAKKPPLRLP